MTDLQVKLEAYANFTAAGKAAWRGISLGTTVAEYVRAPEWAEPTSADSPQNELLMDLPNESVEIAVAAPPPSASTGWTHGLEQSGVVWTARTTELTNLMGDGSGSPFDEIDERREESAKVQELISVIRNSTFMPFARSLACRLEDLKQVAQEEAPIQSEISADSLRTFTTFLRQCPDVVEPEVVLAPDGNIWAEWYPSPRSYCGIEFGSYRQLHYVVFAPDPKNHRRTIRVSGSAHVESFFQSVEPFGVREWIQE